MEIEVAQRISSWKSGLKEGYRVQAEKVTGDFGYAFAVEMAESMGSEILVTPHGQVEGPYCPGDPPRPATSMMEAGDLDGDGSIDLLINWDPYGGPACAIYLNKPNGPLLAWKAEERATCFSAPSSGKPAVFLEIAPPRSNEDVPEVKRVAWDGSAFAVTEVAQIPRERRPAPPSHPLSGRCAGTNDHIDGSGAGSWHVEGTVREGKLVAAEAIVSEYCGANVQNIQLELGKKRSFPVTWRQIVLFGGEPGQGRRGTLTLEVRRNELLVWGTRCGEGREVHTSVSCNWIGPDDIVLIEP